MCCIRLSTFALAASLVVSSIQSSSCSRRSRECFMSSTSSCTWKEIKFMLKIISWPLKKGLSSLLLTWIQLMMNIDPFRPICSHAFSVVCNVNSHCPACNYHHHWAQLKQAKPQVIQPSQNFHFISKTALNVCLPLQKCSNCRAFVQEVHSKFAKPYFSQATWYKTLSLITKKKPQTDQQKLQKASLRLLQKMHPSVGAAETTKTQATHCYRVESCLTYDLWENTDTHTTKYWKWGPCLGLLRSENKGWKSYRSCQTQIL